VGRFLASVLVLLLLGCGPAQDDRIVVRDLADWAAVADHEAPWHLVRFGTPRAEPRQRLGFVPPPEATPAEPFAWVEPSVEIALSWPTPLPRTALLDMMRHPLLDDQVASVSLNGVPLDELHVGERRHWYRIDLPEAAQREGTNILELHFEQGTAPIKPRRVHLAAALHALVWGERASVAALDLEAAQAPPAAGRMDFAADPVPALAQVGPSRLSFGLDATQDAELRFTPDLHPTVRAAGGSVELAVHIETAGAPARELWRANIASTTAAEEVRLALEGLAAGPGRLSLSVESRPGERFAWALWRTPRVLGRSTPAPAEKPAQRQAAALRERLRGTNVILIILDAARADRFGAYGYGRPTSPTIDRLAREGVVFERAYTSAVFTLMAMSSLWTSQHPDRHHAGVAYNARLPRDRVTLAELLDGSGVRTAGFISNAFAGPGWGLDRGFAEFHELYEGGSGRADDYIRVLPEWLERHANERFFLYLHLREPHFPYDPLAPFDTQFGPDEPILRWQRASFEYFEDVNAGRVPFDGAALRHLESLYDGNLAYADQKLGELRELLEAAGVLENSVVIVTSDHGEALREHGHIGHMVQLYEPSVRIPLIVRFPAGLGPAGERVRGFAGLTDLTSTIADIFGVLEGTAADREFQGGSLLPAMYGAGTRPTVHFQSYGERPRYAMRDERYKLIFDSSNGREELYDLRSDPGETENVAEDQAVLAALHRQRLHRWILEQRVGRSTASQQAEISEEQMENLRALGYVK